MQVLEKWLALARAAAVGVGADGRARALSDVALCGALPTWPEGCGFVAARKLTEAAELTEYREVWQAR